ncbi:hypothetical protein BJ508DRAFT_313576 [Ascobolus immersus RN42]|uniref:Uncharacterized protein n=1 Tax=Ascobolus immersus RN42 TaxID=1160509 RepID=A0A3N4HK98_ASCIM|nr:hypothetical protein BJ508DRAFT_313576 [Ascobolus immersus RN42]
MSQSLPTKPLSASKSYQMASLETRMERIHAKRQSLEARMVLFYQRSLTTWESFKPEFEKRGYRLLPLHEPLTSLPPLPEIYTEYTEPFVLQMEALQDQYENDFQYLRNDRVFTEKVFDALVSGDKEEMREVRAYGKQLGHNTWVCGTTLSIFIRGFAEEGLAEDLRKDRVPTDVLIARHHGAPRFRRMRQSFATKQKPKPDEKQLILPRPRVDGVVILHQITGPMPGISTALQLSSLRLRHPQVEEEKGRRANRTTGSIGRIVNLAFYKSGSTKGKPASYHVPAMAQNSKIHIRPNFGVKASYRILHHLDIVQPSAQGEQPKDSPSPGQTNGKTSPTTAR